MEPSDQVLKVDRGGRVWTPREKRAEIVAQFERSGMPACRFAAHVGVKSSTFANWVQKQRREERKLAQRSAPALNWVEALRAPAPAAALCVHLPGGARLEIADAGQARLAVELLRMLMSESAVRSC
jgi:transposase-like protein